MKAGGFLIILGGLAILAAAGEESLPRVLLRDPRGPAATMPITAAAVKLEIVGNVVQTKATLTFLNPNAWEAEADLYYPLPTGAVVNGYGLDVDGAMVDGVAVDRARGRMVFDDIVRKRRDPGLAEWLSENQFHTRVFPVPARGSRTVAIQYLQELPIEGDQAVLRVPLLFGEQIKDISFQADVSGATTAPAVKGGVTDLEFKPFSGGFRAKGVLAKPPASTGMTITISQPTAPAATVERAPDGECYFCIQGKAQPIATKAMDTPKSVMVAWDGSGSQSRVDHEKALDVLKAFFNRFESASVDVDLVVFRHAITARQIFHIKGGKADELLSSLREVDYDGATRMEFLQDLAAATKPDMVLLITDGQHTLGEPPKLDESRPVFALSCGPAADHEFLQGIAGRTSGQYLRLDKLAVADAAAAIGQKRPAWRASLTPAGAAELSGNSLSPDGRYILTGRLVGTQAKVAMPGSTSQSLTIQRDEALPGNVLGRLWAQRKLQELLAAGAADGEVAALGKRYGLVTPATSLIVLERLDQYLQYHICPPASRPQMREEYLTRTGKRVEARPELDLGLLDAWKTRASSWGSVWQDKYRAGLPSTKDDKLNKPADLPKHVYKHDKESPDPPTDRGIWSSNSSGSSSGEESSPSRWPEPPAYSDPSTAKPSSGSREIADGLSDSGRDALASGESEPLTLVIPWNAGPQYMEKLFAASPEQRWGVYLHERSKHHNSPAFFLECGDFFLRRRQSQLAVQVYSNIFEMKTGNALLLQALGRRLAQARQWDMAVAASRQAIRCPDAPPALSRDLALALVRLAESLPANRRHGDDAQACYDKAVEELHLALSQENVLTGCREILLTDLAHVLSASRASGHYAGTCKVDNSLESVTADLRVVLTWDAESPATTASLRLVPDRTQPKFTKNETASTPVKCTDGPGLQECAIPYHDGPGCSIRVDCKGPVRGKLLGPAMLYVEVTRNFGRPDEATTCYMRAMPASQQSVYIDDVLFESDSAKKERNK